MSASENGFSQILQRVEENREALGVFRDGIGQALETVEAEMRATEPELLVGPARRGLRRRYAELEGQRLHDNLTPLATRVPQADRTHCYQADTSDLLLRTSETALIERWTAARTARLVKLAAGCLQRCTPADAVEQDWLSGLNDRLQYVNERLQYLASAPAGEQIRIEAVAADVAKRAIPPGVAGHDGNGMAATVEYYGWNADKPGAVGPGTIVCLARDGTDRPVGPGLRVVDNPADALRCAQTDLLDVLRRENDRLPLDGPTDRIKPEQPAPKDRFW